MEEVKLPSIVELLVKHVMGNEEVKVTDWDLDRTYVNKDGDEYFIRTWDITKTFVRYTVFRTTTDGKEHGAEAVSEGKWRIPKSLL